MTRTKHGRKDRGIPADARAAEGSRRSRPEAIAEKRWRPDLLGLGLASLAVLVRLPHLGWGLPEVEEEALPMKQAIAMWGWEHGRFVLDPGLAGWPSLSFYIQIALQIAHYWVGLATGAFANRDDYFIAHWLDNGPVLILARAAAVAATAGIVWCGYRLARRLSGVEAGLLVGGLLALSPMLVEYAQLVTPDVWVALFTALAVVRIVEFQRRGATADYVWAGIWIGLGISSKYTPVLLLPALFVAHALRERPGRQAVTASLLAREPWLGVLAAAVAFSITSPYVLLYPARTLHSITEQTFHMTAGHFGRSGVSPPIEYFIHVLAPALGWVGLVLSVAGLSWACVRFRGPWLALAACIVPYYVALSLLKAQFPRYMLPLIMPLAAGIGGLVAVLRDLPLLRERIRFVTVALAIASMAPVGISTWRYHLDKARPSAQHLANELFLKDPALRHAHIASEVLGLSLPTARTFDALPTAFLQRLTAAQRQRLFSRPVFDMDLIPMYTVQPEYSAFYYDLRHYLHYDFVAVSEGVRGRYFMQPERYPQQIGFYRDLDRYATLVHRFGPQQGARPPEIRIYQVPEDVFASLRERGPVDLSPANLGKLASTPTTDFMVFVEGVARAAYARGDWTMAARYYRLLWEEAPHTRMAPEEREALGRMIAQLEARARAPADSARR